MSAESTRPVGAGIVGAGNISGIYLKNLTGLFDNVTVLGIADLVVERAVEQGTPFGVRGMPVDELLAMREIELVVNLTIPAAHHEIALRAVEAGKSVYNEKPLTAQRADGQRLLALATERGVRVGGAPDTFLGGGLQTGRKLIDDGWIGRPIAATAFMASHGHESWHPDPSFFYQPGAGPMLDMGPYYVTALVSLLGPVRRVGSATGRGFLERMITSKPKAGEVIAVNTPTHIASTLDFASGAIGTLLTSFDLWDTTHTVLTIYGTDGTLKLPDPNTFGGTVELLQPAHLAGRTPPLFQGVVPDDEPKAPPVWTSVPLTHGYTENSRGLGVSDLARAIREGGPARASGDLAYHVLDVMHATLESSEAGAHVDIRSTVERPEPLPADA